MDQKSFLIRKKTILNKLNSKNTDKSKQGHIDEEIVDLVNTINNKKNCYTTSSCAGRILILFRPTTKIKSDVIWVFKSHKISKSKDIIENIENFLKSNEKKGTLIFKQEPMILHIAVNSFEIATQIFDCASKAGFRRKNIISYNKRIILEITSSKEIQFPIGTNNEINASKKFITWITKFANENLIYNKNKIDSLTKKIKHKDI